MPLFDAKYCNCGIEYTEYIFTTHTNWKFQCLILFKLFSKTSHLNPALLYSTAFPYPSTDILTITSSNLSSKGNKSLPL